MFYLQNTKVTCCGNCPKNKEFPNGFYDHWLLKYVPIPKGVLSSTHRCEATLDTALLNKDGRLILNPLSIPAWCPFDA